MSKSSIRLLLVFFIVLGLVLRFFKLPDLLYFNMDEERDAFIVKRIVVDHRPTLIGGSVPGGFYVGPAFYYLSAIPTALSGLNPVGLGIAASLLGAVSVWLIYIAGLKLFNSRVGLWAAFFYSISYLIVIYNRHYWPLTPAPIAAMIVLLALSQIVKRKYNYSYLLVMGLIFGLQSDPSNITLLFLTFFVWVKWRLPLKKKPILLSGLLLLFSHLPLVLFDLRHNFVNLRALGGVVSSIGKGGSAISLSGVVSVVKLFPQTVSRLMMVLGSHDVSKQLTPCPQYQLLRQSAVPVVLLIISSFLLIFWLIKTIGLPVKDKKKTGLSLIFLHLSITFFGIVVFTIFFPEYIREYFLSVCLPSFVLLIGLTAHRLSQVVPKPLTYFVFLLWAVFNINALFVSTNSLGFSNKMNAVKYGLQEVGEETFFLESLSSCFKYNGSRYLFYLAGQEPAVSFMDQHYAWLYDRPPASFRPAKGIILVSHDIRESSDFWREYNEYKPYMISAQKFGDIEALIVDYDKTQ